MISLLLPSRGRPQIFQRMVDSARATAHREIEVIVRLDSDDPTADQYKIDDADVLVGPREVLSVMWNECYAEAGSDIVMHCGDDIVFQTDGWDDLVYAAFEEYPDKIAFVHGQDLCGPPNFGTHGFLHRRWVETVGYFVPPYFVSDYNDTWINEVANMIGRRVEIPIITEHMHFMNGKAFYDATYRERLERHRLGRVDQLYASMAADRVADAEKLRRVMT